MCTALYGTDLSLIFVDGSQKHVLGLLSNLFVFMISSTSTVA